MSDDKTIKILNIKKQLYKLAIARSDIGTVLQLCRLCTSIKSDRRRNALNKMALQDALISSIIASYSRPFSDNQPYGPLQKKWSKFDNPLHRNLHEKIIQFRNKKIAHTDYETRQVYLYTSGYYDKEAIGALLITTRTFPLEEIPVIIDMCNILMKRFKSHTHVLTTFLLKIMPTSTLQPIELFSQKPLKQKNSSN